MSKEYSLYSTFGFGKHNSQTVSEVVDEEPSYIRWCIKNLDYLVFSDGVLDAIKASKELRNKNEQNLQNLEEADEARAEAYEEAQYQRELDRDCWDAMTGGQYGDYPGGDIDYDEFGF